MTHISQEADIDERTRRVLRERAESLAQAEREEEAAETKRLLLFKLGEETYALDVEDVREIASGLVVTPIPCVPAHVLGVINVRGEILSVIDLAGVLGVGLGSSQVAEEGESGIIVRSGDVASVLVVDEIGDIIEVPASSVEPPLAALDRAHAETVSGTVYWHDSLIAVVNLERVLEPVGERA